MPLRPQPPKGCESADFRHLRSLQLLSWMNLTQTPNSSGGVCEFTTFILVDPIFSSFRRPTRSAGILRLVFDDLRKHFNALRRSRKTQDNAKLSIRCSERGDSNPRVQLGKLAFCFRGGRRGTLGHLNPDFSGVVEISGYKTYSIASPLVVL